MRNRIIELREQRAKLIADAKALVPEKGEISADSQAKIDAMLTDEKRMKAEIDRLEALEAASEDVSRTAIPPQARIADKSTETAADETKGDAESRKKAEKRAFRKFLLGGERYLTPEDRQYLRPGGNDIPEEARAIGVGSPTGIGYFVPTGFSNQVEKATKAYGPMLETSTIYETASGENLHWPTSNDTSNTGQLVGEHELVSEQDVAVSEHIFRAFDFNTKIVRASLRLLQDSAFDVETFLADCFAERIGRTLNSYFTDGAGTTEPEGIITGATDSGQTMVGDDNATTPDPTSEVGLQDLVNLEHSVDISYRRGAAWMMHDTTARFIKLLRDKYGRPLFLPGLAINAPDTILGYPYYINNDMDELAAGAKAVLFGQLKKYLVRRVRGLYLLRLDQRYAEYGQMAFLGWCRYDGGLLDAGTHPVKYLTTDSE